jgi:hypothetical protein
MERPFERAASSRLEMGRRSWLDTAGDSTSVRLLRFGLREGAAPYRFSVDCINLDWERGFKIMFCCGARRRKYAITLVGMVIGAPLHPIACRSWTQTVVFQTPQG